MTSITSLPRGQKPLHIIGMDVQELIYVLLVQMYRKSKCISNHPTERHV